MRAIIAAQGDGRRWTATNPDGSGDGPYLGHPKHFIVVDGETLLARTVRLFRDRGVHDVVVVGPDARYRVDGARLVTLEDPDPAGCDMSKFVATEPLWSPSGRTVLAWGDCFYTDEAVDSLLARTEPGYHVWRRPGRSNTTGHRWDESFFVAFDPDDHAAVLVAAHRIAALDAKGEFPRGTHIRTHLAAMAGIANLDSTRAVRDAPMQTCIDDWTDDIDSPAEWRQWMGRRHAGRNSVAVCIPWVDTGDDWRRWSKDWTAKHWADVGVPVHYGNCGNGPTVNRSAGRNDAARRAIADGAEILFFADADTFVPADQLWAAAHLATISGRLTRAYLEWSKASRGATTRLRHHGTAQLRAQRTATNHSSGAVAVPVDLWRQVGGYDERFRSWGAEDRAFWLACNTIAGWGWSVDGTAWHLWHPHSPERNPRSDQYQANVALGMRYKQAAGVVAKSGILPATKDDVSFTPITAGDPAAIRAILAEPGGPLAGVHAGV